MYEFIGNNKILDLINYACILYSQFISNKDMIRLHTALISNNFTLTTQIIIKYSDRAKQLMKNNIVVVVYVTGKFIPLYNAVSA